MIKTYVFKCVIRFNRLKLVTLQPLSNRKWNGEPMGFKVFYKKISDANFTTIIPKYSLTVHRSHIVGLQEGLDYQVKMLAFNDVGESPFSAIITTKLGKI